MILKFFMLSWRGVTVQSYITQDEYIMSHVALVIEADMATDWVPVSVERVD